MTIIPDRLALLDTIDLDRGPHRSRDDGMCPMEAAAWLAGEDHSDHPESVSPVVARFMRSWAEGLPSRADRNRLLRPLVPMTVGTRTTEADEETRAWMATDWLVREQAPAWLRLAGLVEHAEALERLAELTGSDSAVVAQPSIDAALAAAWDAAREDARDAAQAVASWAAARDAARATSWDARDSAWTFAREDARDAAQAVAQAASWAAAREVAQAVAYAVAREDARDAAQAIAQAASWAAARAAARAVAYAVAREDARDLAQAVAQAASWAAARAAARAVAYGGDLSPTVDRFQRSACRLVERMCAVGRDAS